MPNQALIADTSNDELLQLAAEEYASNVEQLIGNEVNVNSVLGSSGKHTQLHTAARHGCVADIKALLAKGAHVNVRSAYCDLPIHLAAECGSLGATELLIANGGDIHAMGYATFTPLHLAVRGNYVDVVKLLVDEGADVNAGCCNSSPFHIACQKGLCEVIELFITKGAQLNSVAAMERLIAEGADVNAVAGSTNYTPLHYAIDREFVAGMELLIANGANVNAKDIFNKTPLQAAALSRNGAVRELLLAEGADG